MEKSKLIKIALVLIVLLIGLWAINLLAPHEVEACDLTRADIEMLEALCLEQLNAHQNIRLGHSGGGDGTLYLCYDDTNRNSSDFQFESVQFLADTYEGKSYDGDRELSLGFSIDAYCFMEGKRKTLYSEVKITNPERRGGELAWDKIEWDMIMDFGVYTMYRFADEPTVTGTGYQLSDHVLGKT